MLNNKKIKNHQSKLIFLLFTLACLLYGKDTNNTSHTISVIVPKIALLDIESDISNDITLEILSPSEAGNSLQQSATNNNLWLNVTSVAESGNFRDITVKINKPMKGVDINVVSDTYSGLGYGSWGTPLPQITLSPNDQTLISGIKSGISGDGIFNGFNLKYSAQIADSNYGSISSSENKDITVTYTLTQ
jgi:hypothetical protein